MVSRESMTLKLCISRKRETMRGKSKVMRSKNKAVNASHRQYPSRAKTTGNNRWARRIKLIASNA